MGICFFVYNLFRSFIWSALTTCCSCLEVGNIRIDENLKNYYEALDEDDKTWLVKEEENTRTSLNFNILSDHSLKKLREAKPSKTKVI
jgi:hypothetical protein